MVLTKYMNFWDKFYLDFCTLFSPTCLFFLISAYTAFRMSHLPRPTSGASTSSSSGIGTLPSGSKILKPGFTAPSMKRENSSVSTSTPTPLAPMDLKNDDTFQVGDKVKKCIIFGFRYDRITFFRTLYFLQFQLCYANIFFSFQNRGFSICISFSF